LADKELICYSRDILEQESANLNCSRLPLSKYRIDLDDDSETGKRILQLLQQSEQNRDVSLLEEAGELLMAQSTKLPRHWQTPAPLRLVHNELSDEAYRFSPMSNDPFAKVGNVKISQSMSIPRAVVVPNEPQHTTYPDMLVNPPERWVRKSPNDPQPMQLVRPLPLPNSCAWLDEQLWRQLGVLPNKIQTKTPSASTNSMLAKAPDSYRVRKPVGTMQSKAKAPTSTQQLGTSRGFQGPLAQSGQPIKSNSCIPQFQAGYQRNTPYNTGSQACPSNASQAPLIPPTRSTNPPTNPAGKQNPRPVKYNNQFPTPPTSARATPSTHPANNTMRPITNQQQQHNATSYETFFSQSPAIRKPTSPLTRNVQGYVPLLEPKPCHNKSVTTTVEPEETESYDEMYRKAKETADNLTKMLKAEKR
jgi:hypothetical protein